MRRISKFVVEQRAFRRRVKHRGHLFYNSENRDDQGVRIPFRHLTIYQGLVGRSAFRLRAKHDRKRIWKHRNRAAK